MPRTPEEKKIADKVACRKWRESHPEAKREYDRKYRKKHQEERQAKHRAWAVAHPDLMREYQHNYRERNLEQRRESERKWRRAHPESKLKRKYGMTLDEYEQLFEAQGGVCAICSEHRGKYPLTVDHNHITGAIRALVCSKCNTLLGMADDRPDILRKAADYLDQHSQ